MSKALAVFAGKSALAHIKQHGLGQEQIKMMVGASGGPKWFVLAGLDRYFCGDYFKDRTQPLYTLGSSAGAWRFACYAQKGPLEAINRLIHGYSHMSYPEKATIAQITEQSEQLLSHILGKNGVDEVVQNPIVKSTIIVAKSLGLTKFEHKAIQLPGLITSAIANRINRKNLGKYYQRAIFTSDTNNIPFDFNDGINSQVTEINASNYQLALQATGAIPLIINGVKNIPDAGTGMFRDGGIIDYHFDQPFLGGESAEGIVLYPHFYNEFKPGWFDKYVKHRFANKQHFDNVLVIAPTPEFVAKLPFAKIPDRKDFTQLTEKDRIAYWNIVVSESERLAQEFFELVNSDNPADKITLI
ncbi:patatin-like phospholipase family protein [Thalassomonas sp. M1454]|uniref:patatin-like phospholipase family protein n=1 Tax=Thalassomonas sp. M1454 TaxID=2594477 RepID=UPI00117E73D9|nr:patatin-like phospholipase family protein [Thalassomonas sp. M1454]TRX56360.1 patatin-like phospholipase family protein [Thalassomonas sp. M1454]